MSDEGGIINEKDPRIIDALVRKFDAEAAKLEAEALEANYLALDAKLDYEKNRLMADVLDYGDDKHRVFRLGGEIDSKTVPGCITTLTRWSRQDPGCEITLIITSPGGSVIDGLALFDFLMELRERGHKITAIVRGYAASMAGILLQAADERVIGKEAWVLIHEVSAMAMGSFGELEDRMKWLAKVQGRILDVFAERSDGKKSRDDFENAWKRTDFWLSSEDCLEWGVADRIA